jgi:positive regulator of sigma E activity
MDTKKEVTHTGIIGKIDKKGIKVTIGVLAGCTNCQIKGNCNMAEQSVKELFIECDSSQYKTGQRVMISVKSERKTNVQFLKYILPFIILLSSMLISSAFTRNETMIGIVSILTLISYFILFIFSLEERRKNKEKVKYQISTLFE